MRSRKVIYSLALIFVFATGFLARGLFPRNEVDVNPLGLEGDHIKNHKSRFNPVERELTDLQSDEANLRLAVRNLSEEEIPEIWNAIENAEISNRKKREFRDDLLGAFARIHGVEAGIQFVYSRSGPGRTRARYIEALFAYSEEDNAFLVRRLEELAFSDERSSAANALAWNNVRPEDFSGLSAFSSEGLTLYQNSLAQTLGLRESLGRRGGEIAADQLESILVDIESGRLPADFIDSYFSAISYDSPFIAWSTLSDFSKARSPLEDDTRSRIIHSLIQNNPQQALDVLSHDSTVTFDEYSSAVSEWLAEDSSQAGEWVESALPFLPEGRQDAVFSSFVDYGISYSEFDNVKPWAGRINDPILRQRTLDEISRSEQDVPPKSDRAGG